MFNGYLTGDVQPRMVDCLKKVRHLFADYTAMTMDVIYEEEDFGILSFNYRFSYREQGEVVVSDS